MANLIIGHGVSGCFGTNLAPKNELTDQKALAYFSTLCNIDGGQGITCQPKHITVTCRAPRRPIPLLPPSNSAKSYAVFAALSPRKR